MTAAQARFISAHARTSAHNAGLTGMRRVHKTALELASASAGSFIHLRTFVKHVNVG